MLSSLNLDGKSNIPGLSSADLASIRDFIATPSNFVAWEPHKGVWDDAVQSRIEGLEIPVIDQRSDYPHPDFLLHTLGHLDVLDSSFSPRIESFTDGSHHMLLVNTSGAGKTRLVFETLSRHWGFYFTPSLNIMNPYGSNDLRNALVELERMRIYHTLPDSDRGSNTFRTKFETNRGCISKLLARIILARLLLLDFFATTVCDLGMSDNDARTKWVWLQLRASRIIRQDVFAAVYGGLQSWTEADIQANMEELLDKHREKVQFIAFDEAQALNQMFHKTFVSEDFSSYRPVLRELVYFFASTFDSSRIIVSGTRVDDGLMEDAISESSSRNRSVRRFCDLGDFMNHDDARRYATYFLGPDLSTDNILRCFYGRRRFLAVLVESILTHGGRVAPEVVNSIMYATTGLKRPGLKSNILMPYGLIAPDDVLESFPFARDLRCAAYSNIALGKPALIYDDPREIAGGGMARLLDDMDVCQLDEPLILLTLARWPLSSARWSTRALIQRRLDDPSVVTRNMALPEGLAVYLWLRWAASGLKLNEIVSFVDGTTPRWATQRAAFAITSWDGAVRSVSATKSLKGPLIRAADNFDDVEEWFRSSPTPFLIPDNDMGPQLVFILDALDGPRLVFVHVEPYEHDRPRRAEAVTPINPYNFYANKRSHRKLFREILASFPSQASAQQSARTPSFNTLQIYCFARVRASNVAQRPPIAKMLSDDIVDEIGKHDIRPVDVINGIP